MHKNRYKNINLALYFANIKKQLTGYFKGSLTSYKKLGCLVKNIILN